MTSDHGSEDTEDCLSGPFRPEMCFEGLRTYTFTSIDDMKKTVARVYDEFMEPESHMAGYVVFTEVSDEMADNVISQRGLFGENARFDLYDGNLHKMRIKFMPPVLRTVVAAFGGMINSQIADMGLEGEMVSFGGSVTRKCSASDEQREGSDTCSSPRSTAQGHGVGDSLPGENKSEINPGCAPQTDK